MESTRKLFGRYALVIVVMTQAAQATPYDPADVPPGPVAAVTLSSSALAQDTLLYQPWFDAANWSGDLLAFAIDAEDGQTTTQSWSAARLLTDRDWHDRLIITRRDDTGQAILLRQFGDLSFAQQAALGDQAALDYLRGDPSQEGGRFRVRRSLDNRGRPIRNILGPLIHADPQYLGSGDTASVYAAANDGMLHVFAAGDGHERYAYVPAMIFPRLAALVDEHSTVPPPYTVDGGIAIAAVRFGNGSLHTVLVGALGAGGQGLYALDVTNHAVTDESAALQSELWEFTDSSDSALGYVHGAAHIVQLNDGHWAALLGNGYASDAVDAHTGSGSAALLIIDIESGALLRRLDTYAGDSADPNGLGPVRSIDIDADGRADYAYAGDLQGHLWRFDLHDASSGKWRVSFNTAPLYSARASDGHAQAITSAPAIIAQSQQGVRLLFGTGQLLSWADIDPASGNQDNAIYGVRDRLDSTLPDPDKTATYTLTEQTYADAVRVLTSSDATLSGEPDVWRTNLATGARVITDPLLDSGRLICTVSQPLISDGEVWLLALDAQNGGAPRQVSFDLNGDGTLDTQDDISLNPGSTDAQSGARVAGRYYGTGLGSAPVTGNLDANRRVSYINRLAIGSRPSPPTTGDSAAEPPAPVSNLNDTSGNVLPGDGATLTDGTRNLIDTAPPCGVNGCVAEARSNPGRVTWKELLAE